jgi:BirA family biotin operon repressor/biotin-[acetyl-CoA-carboxylase] ligase
VGSDWFTEVHGTRFRHVTWVPEIGSTNTELLEAARAGVPEGRVMIADLQTAGRGRRGRQWTAPPGTALMMSVLLRPPAAALPPRQATLVTMAFAAAAAEACARETGVEPGIKWPNDLVVEVDLPAGHERDQGYRKLAGILTESVVSGNEISALVVGMGLNTGWPEVPVELAGVATSLNLLAGLEIDRPSLARRILTGFERRYAALLDGRYEQVLDEARRRSVTIGRRVRIELARDEFVEGLVTDLDDEGHLLVRSADDTVHVLAVGDVVHVRPGGS